MITRAYAQTQYGQLHYAEQGPHDSTEAAVLCLHQTPRSHDEFLDVMPHLSPSLRVIAMDMVGFGQSANLPAPQHLEDYARGGFALLDALGIERAIILGHHTGANVAICMGAMQPRRVRALLLSSPAFINQGWRDRHGPDKPVVDQVERQQDGSHLLELWQFRQRFYPVNRPDILERFIRDALAPGVDPAEGHIACARYRMEDDVEKVVAPTLILAADHDIYAYPEAELVRKQLTAAERVEMKTIEGGGVALMEQKPKEVADALNAFLATL